MLTHVANPLRIAHEVLARVIAPPPPIDYLAWAKKNIYFGKRESPSFPGPYNEDLFPYFTEILNALSLEDPCRTVTLKKSAQIGGTVVANIFTLGSMDLDPGDFLYTHPTDNNARKWSTTKLTPMLEKIDGLKDKFPSPDSKKSNIKKGGKNTETHKDRNDGLGSIMIAGSNSPAELSMITVSRQVQDDLAKWNDNKGGDPEKQANSRSRGVEFAKIFKNSTPLVNPGCRISKNFQDGTQEHYHVPCPHCGEYQELTWENFASNLDEDHPEQACFSCNECGGLIEEYHRQDICKRGKWIAKNPQAARTHRSFYIWSAYSVLQSFERIAQEYIAAKGDPGAEQTFFNDTLGLAFEVDGSAPPWEDLRDRASRSFYQKGQIPPRALVLTLGIDVQEDRLEWQLVGWGRKKYRAVIDYGVIPGHISDRDIYKRIENVIYNTWTNSVGRKVEVTRAAIDGNAFTGDVWAFTRRLPQNKLMMVRGFNQEHAQRLFLVKNLYSADGKRKQNYAKRFYNFNAHLFKFGLYECLKKQDPEAYGFIDFPQGLDEEYFMQLTSERRMPIIRNGFTVYRWIKDPGQPNEGLDTMNQAEAAAENLVLENYTELDWDRLEAKLLAPVEDLQLDLEDVPLVPPQAEEPRKPAPKKKRAKRRAKRRQFGKVDVL